KPSLSIRGKVLDAESGSPLESFSVDTGVVDTKTGAVAWRPGQGWTSDDGEYRLELDGTTPAYRLRFSAPDHATFESGLFLGTEIRVDYDARLERIAGPGPPGAVRSPEK